jgi:hypothetical protein
MRKQAQFSIAEAKEIGDALSIDWRAIAFDQFHTGLEAELVRTVGDARTATSQEDALITGRIAMAHLQEHPDYYVQMSAMEKETDAYWVNV